MTGSAAESNMQGFDFTDTWKTVSGDYPILSWESRDSDGDGNLSPDNPFGDGNNEPLDRGEVITKIIDWNRDQNNELDGVSYTRQEIIGFIIEWNRA
jgi:hypothetical protein